MLIMLMIVAIGVVVISTTMEVVEFEGVNPSQTHEALHDKIAKIAPVKDHGFQNRRLPMDLRDQPDPDKADDPDNEPGEVPLITRQVKGWFILESGGDNEKVVAALNSESSLRAGENFEFRVVKRYAFIWTDGPIDFFHEYWNQAYLGAEIAASGEKLSPFDGDSQQEMQNRAEALDRRFQVEKSTSKLQRSVESVFDWSMSFFYTISMILFIAACAGYFPGLLAAGAVDVVLSKPISRFYIFVGKYLGGLLLFAIAVLLATTILYFGMGMRTGIWVSRAFTALPLLVFSAAVIFSLLALIGVLTRSTAMAMIIGYLFYVVIDTVLATAIGLYRSGVMDEVAWLKKIVETIYYVFPNFVLLKNTAVTSVMTQPYVDWQPVGTAAAWMVLSLALGFWRFRAKDY